MLLSEDILIFSLLYVAAPLPLAVFPLNLLFVLYASIGALQKPILVVLREFFMLWAIRARLLGAVDSNPESLKTKKTHLNSLPCL